MRRWFLLIFLLLMLVVAGFAMRMSNLTLTPEDRRIMIDDVAVDLIHIADTDQERSQGLSNHPGLYPGQGLLFVFDREGQYSFWMKDMRFAIDILWINAQGHVVTIAHGVTPDTYPKAFTSDSPAQYVLEVPAGFALTHNIRVGSQVVF